MSDPTAATDLVTLTIDGVEVQVPKGTLIIRAAEQIGTIVPRFCDHPLLDPVGACRQCVVEVEGAPKPVMSCTQPVAPDMVVRTHLTSELARRGQEGTLELLLINHPLDCPMCDKGGECPLQDQALAHGRNTSTFIDQKRKYDKPVAVSPQVLLDRERCVLCARCTRFSEQISGDPFIELFERGALEQVAIYEDEPYHSYFSGNVIQICPVGALTSTTYRFKARPFDVVTTPSVCDGCASGCTQTVQARRGEVQRQLARTNMAVNEAWNCDKGRFGFQHLTHPQRLTVPLERIDGELVETTWSSALRRIAAAVTASRVTGAGRTALITGGRLADEDAYAAARFARTVLATDLVEHRTRFAPADEAPARAALLAGGVGGGVGAGVNATYADVEAAPVIIVAALDPEEESPILHLRLRKAWRNRRARIVVVGPNLGTLGDLAWRRVVCAPGDEAAALARVSAAVAGRSDDIAAALADAQAAGRAAVVLVGERAGAGTLSAARTLADTVAGRVGFVPRRSGDVGGLAAGLAPGLLPGGRLLSDATDRAEVEAVWGPLPTSLPTAAEAGPQGLHGILEAAVAGTVDVLHLAGIDLARDADAPGLAERALAKVAASGTVVVQDLALTETAARYADVVLPVTATQERAGTRTNWEGRAQRFSRAVDGPKLAQDDWEVFVQLSALLGHDLGTSGLEGLRAQLATLGLRATPHAMPTASDAGDVAASPVPDGALSAVVRSLLLDHGTMLAGADDLMATARDATITIARRDAVARGIADGDTVAVRSASGAAAGAVIELPAVVADDVLPGVVVLPRSSTAPFVTVLAGDDGRVHVTLEKVASASASAADAPGAGGERVEVSA
jgi:NADH-quinone oxidoreductase subunit G